MRKLTDRSDDWPGYGFFIKFLQNDARAAQVWAEVTSSSWEATLISCITLYELQRTGLKDVIAKEKAEVLLDELPDVCRVLWLTEPTLLRRTAHIAHGNGLAMADAIILLSLMDAGATQIYTTDSDLAVYKAGPHIVKL